ncbi:type VII secretion protein EsaA [Virgibacillus halodenitrificans]|uniref:Type VII secretion protein EsaA n=1 Tax=Virgibacillus halodenitrificans TaxID=1482 RepID=A0ABR7VIS3_VIRHA|nr:type VII secretion protein EsaA [Virgibacillus halodenitrificans]MBD1221591.1 type VII secretion protein EsaA [Virgibacillus halodenitrificans]
MSEGLKSSLTLAAKILVILVLPLLLFRYVDSQPVPAVQEEEDEATRSVAVVNEDTGIIQEEEKLILGQEIPALLNEQKDYKWTVVNRSAAEQGFSNQKYDAIIYVPSTFSENIMTFKEDKPTKAALNYVIQPNLEAKDRQRIHREMATAKNKINEEMSTIYWSYVSKEVDNIRAQFDKILEKEVAFQDAMYSFYTPSSKTLAHEIDQHKNNLENILNQTDQINDVSSDSANAANEAENKMKTFTEALEAYKETQLEQQKLLEAAQTKNQEAITAGMESYNKAMEESMAAMQEKLSQQSVVFKEEQDKIMNRFGNMELNVQRGKETLNEWRNIQEQSQKILLENMNTKFEEILVAPKEELNKAIVTLKEAPIQASLIEPINPEFEESNIDFEELNAKLKELETVILEAKKILGDGKDSNTSQTSEDNLKPDETEKNSSTDNVPSLEEQTEGTVVDLPLIKAKHDELRTILDDMMKNNNTDDIIGDWKEYAKKFNENYFLLVEETNVVRNKVLESIDNKEDLILENVPELENAFNNIKDKDNKKLVNLINYSNALSIFQTTISQKEGVNAEIVNFVENEMEKWEKMNLGYNQDLLKLFGASSEEIKAVQINSDQGVNFSDLINESRDNIKKYDSIIKEQQKQSSEILKALQQNATEITNQLQTVNADTFEWQESPSLEYLDGQMVFSIQQGTASDLKQLSDLVTNLEENQSEITTNTKDLQAQISTVQKQSDELNNKWSVNVASTGLIREDAYEILGNTVVDGQENPFVYNHLANPVNVEGQVNGKVLSETEERVPPVVMFMIILISGLLIGFLSHYYSNNTYLVQGGLFLLLNLAVGMIISIYGLNLYELDDAQAIKWSVFTILLLMACANVVRGGLFIGPFVGWLASIAMIVFFITPLLNIVVPEFTFNNPVSNVYMGLQYGTETSFILTIIVLAAITLAISAFIYTLQVMRNKARVEPNEEKAS